MTPMNKDEHTPSKVWTSEAMEAGSAMAERYFRHLPHSVLMDEAGLRRLLIAAYADGVNSRATLLAQNREMREMLERLVEVYGKDHPLQCWVDARALLSQPSALVGSEK